jgi:hypothetical protein
VKGTGSSKTNKINVMKYFFILATMMIIHFSLIRFDKGVLDSKASSKHSPVVSSDTTTSKDEEPAFLLRVENSDEGMYLYQQQGNEWVKVGVVSKIRR